MRRDPARLGNAIKNYPSLGGKEKETLHTWLSMTGNFLFAAIKVAAGFAAGNGYLCVSALYSALIGIAKNHYIRFSYDENYKTSSEVAMFGFFGFLIALAGIVYGIYMGRLIASPRIIFYEVWQGLMIAAVCICDMIIAVRGLIKVPDKCSSLLLLGRKLLSLAAAIPAAIMAHTALNACTALTNSSFWDGVFGVLAGAALVFMGVFMVLYARRNREYEDENDVA